MRAGIARRHASRIIVSLFMSVFLKKMSCEYTKTIRIHHIIAEINYEWLYKISPPRRTVEPFGTIVIPPRSIISTWPPSDLQ